MERAKKLIAEADRKLSPGSGLINKIFGSASKTDDAIDLLVQAGGILKMEKEWAEAGKIFTRIADLYFEMGNKHDAASKYIDASNCYKKCNIHEAIACSLKAINIYTDMGRFSVAAKQHMAVAEVYEDKGRDIPKAIEHYSKAADYYQCEESVATANRCLLNVARYAAQLENYQRAIEIYESIGSSSLDNNLLKYGAKEHFLRAGLCHLCVDTLNAKIATKKYMDMSPAFADSRECKLLEDLISKIEALDVEGFAEVVKDYDSISRLDPWFTTLLLRVKNNIVEEDDLK